jgi:glutamate 5-kinase
LWRMARVYCPAVSWMCPGSFEEGDMVAIQDAEGIEFARGLVNYNARELKQIKGMRTEKAC